MMGRIGIVAIHGGNIEEGTTEIAKKIAGAEFPVFVNEKWPHISSVDFKSEEFDDFVKDIDIIISIHGEKTQNESFVMVGGLHKELRNKLESVLDGSGFKTKIPPENLDGDNIRNICNRGRMGRGVQIEVSRKLRYELVNNDNLWGDFSKSIREVLMQF